MEWKSTEGISLRDYFAAAALQGLLAGAPNYHETKASKAAYAHADAMLAAREKQGLTSKGSER